ncbi:SGNH hydrolase-like domain-containing protein, acetyltransferase AlgX [Methylobacterium phyllostachyos]|uniref:SGNH hydrolase-like domain-containing protein, acetyltransferase AlgX n=2 Tax=Methylobacterium phyllostachyos TaxID=582672 RepID=A0A1G9YYS1_9HYPH|nr:SGNH hydrolase-like domain-containing protein, acetyltransferase AlgX [Methylobacterium phyllostachyos]
MKKGNGVAVGNDGWLYWVGRTNEVEAFYGDTALSRRILKRWARLIAKRARRLDALGIHHVHAVVPDKLAVYPDMLGRAFPGLDEPPCQRLAQCVAEVSDAPMIDLLPPLRAARSDEPVYLRTDTHWTYRGYLAAYRTLCEALHAPVAEHVFTGTQLRERFTFDLGEKLHPPVDEEYVAYDFPRGAERIDVNALVRLRESRRAVRPRGLFVGSRVVMRNAAAADPRRVVIFGDSYIYSPGARLTAMLSETFGEVHAIWSANLDWSYIEAIRPDIFIFEIAERFLRKVPTDRIDIDTFAKRRAKRALRPTLSKWIRQQLNRMG